ncbi:hypothetical protein PCNPT3_12850 [Psychromonas sp. CNPT3]|uniref:DUF2975 domain-containing protein n=1 Tax=Psychromonas sp. CNPT3 TaxID=314282 RepID=UPI00006E4857|nr:DUF2975 domain-containing protein [Psychromonas sp. CNPT3]AGH82506.1 hypothetical protein PCNPT3_12850 [Psychromonas sp. CNPT3]
MHNIQTLSRRLRIFLQIMLVTLPILFVAFWLTANTSYDLYQAYGLGFDVSQYNLSNTLTPGIRLLAASVSALLLMIPLYALKKLICLFKHYENMQIFSEENARIYQTLGYTLLIWTLCNFIYTGFISITLTFNNPVGERMFFLSFEGNDVLNLCSAFLIIIISKVMQTGHQLAEENSQTI